MMKQIFLSKNKAIAFISKSLAASLFAIGTMIFATSCSEDAVVVEPPVAAFEVTVNGLSATFTNNSKKATSYSWDFGDDQTSTDKSPVHTYAAAGSFTVTLTASSDTESVTATQTIVTTSVEAGFTSVIDDLVVTFTNTSQNATSYSWDFGVEDATDDVSTDESPSYTYTANGDYIVTLVSKDDSGNESTVTETVSIRVAAFINGTFDDYGDSDSPDYQLNNDAWELPTVDFTWEGAAFKAGGMSKDGEKLEDGTLTNAAKIYDPTRGLYQEIEVVIGKSYIVTFRASTEVVTVPEEILVNFYLLNGPIKSEAAINAENTYDTVNITSYAEASKTNFQTYTMEFTATTTSLVFFAKTALGDATSSSTESWIDNIKIASKK